MQPDIFQKLNHAAGAASIPMEQMRVFVILGALIGILLFIYKVYVATMILLGEDDEWPSRIAFLLTTLLMPFGVGAMIADRIRLKSPFFIVALLLLLIGFGIAAGLTLKMLPHATKFNFTIPNW